MSTASILAARRAKEPRLGRGPVACVVDNDAIEPGLTATQFTRHISHVIEDQTRRALDRYVGDVGAGEIVDMARNLGQMKARYIAQSLAVATNRKPPSRADAQEMRWMREQIEEMELAFQVIRDAITNEMIPLRDLAPAEAAERQSSANGAAPRDMLS